MTKLTKKQLSQNRNYYENKKICRGDKVPLVILRLFCGCFQSCFFFLGFLYRLLRPCQLIAIKGK